MPNPSPSPHNGSVLIRRVWREYIKSFLPYLLLALGFMVLYALTTAMLPYLMKPVIDDVFKNESIDQLKWVSIAVLITFTFKGVANYGETVTMNYIGQSIIAKLQKRIFQHLMHSDMSFYYKRSSGQLVSLGTYHITMVKNMVANTLTSLGKDSFTLLGLISVMFYQDLFLSCIAFFVLPLAVFPIIRLGKKMRKISGKTQQETGDWVSFMTQTFQGIRVVKSYTMENHEVARGTKIIDTLLHFALKSGKTRSLSSPIMEALGGVAIVIVISYGGWQVISGVNTAGAFFSFITALLLTYEPMKRLANLHTSLQEGLAATQEIFDVLDTKPIVTSPPNAPSLGVRKGEIILNDLCFSYEETPVIKNLSLTFPAGQKIALVGPSGSGKTTLFNLILRFFDPSSGDICIDGQNLRTVDLTSLRQQIGLVSQEVVLFNDTIQENIRYGRPGASDQEVMDAARQAAAHDFVMELPRGYETVVGEMGMKLSGGQRQRISIARAFLKNAPILLLDEATSALDTESEKFVHKALEKLMQHKTCLIIAHRLSTVQNADLIYVMREGSVVESGSHTELLNKGGLYERLCRLQMDTDA